MIVTISKLQLSPSSQHLQSSLLVKCLLGLAFFMHSRENITWFPSVLLTISGTEKASFQTLYVHENLVLALFIKTLSSGFVLLFLFKILWLWEGSVLPKDRWPSEACCCNSNLSYSPPLIKVDFFIMCFLREALDVPGCLSNRRAIFFAFSHECVLMSRLITKRLHVCAQWHGRRSEAVGFLGYTRSILLMTPGK